MLLAEYLSYGTLLMETRNDNICKPLVIVGVFPCLWRLRFDYVFNRTSGRPDVRDVFDCNPSQSRPVNS